MSGRGRHLTPLERVLLVLLMAPLAVYRATLSRLMPPVCRFQPTCSTYMRDALLTHGPLRGLALGTWRLLRCQPLCRGGHDPVPERARHG